MAADDELPVVRAARERYGAALLANPDVHGVGVGLRRRAGQRTDDLAVVVHVARKLPRDEIPPQRLVPGELRLVADDGSERVVRTDVQEHALPTPESGTAVTALDVRRRVRPVPGGVSAGFSGTLGAWVWDPVTSQAVALSNRHVFGSVAGIPIIQPSGDDGGARPRDLIASVVRAARAFDASIAAPVNPAVVSSAIVGAGGAVSGIADAAIGMRVQKTGRTTGLTRGVVEHIDYDSGPEGSDRDLWIDGDGGDFSDGGDSGAVYLEPSTHALVGLHWGGSGTSGVGHPIRAVFDDLGVTLGPP
jgi:hypothetical protein